MVKIIVPSFFNPRLRLQIMRERVVSQISIFPLVFSLPFVFSLSSFPSHSLLHGLGFIPTKLSTSQLLLPFRFKSKWEIIKFYCFFFVKWIIRWWCSAVEIFPLNPSLIIFIFILPFFFKLIIVSFTYYVTACFLCYSVAISIFLHLFFIWWFTSCFLSGRLPLNWTTLVNSISLLPFSFFINLIIMQMRLL